MHTGTGGVYPNPPKIDSVRLSGHRQICIYFKTSLAFKNNISNNLPVVFSLNCHILKTSTIWHPNVVTKTSKGRLLLEPPPRASPNSATANRIYIINRFVLISFILVSSVCQSDLLLQRAFRKHTPTRKNKTKQNTITTPVGTIFTLKKKKKSNYADNAISSATRMPSFTVTPI